MSADDHGQDGNGMLPFWHPEDWVPAGAVCGQVEHAGGRIRHVRLPGTGRPLLLIPGLNEPWHSYAPSLPALQAHFTPVLIELRGHGPGRGAAPATGYTVDHYADDVVAVLEQLAGSGAILAGNSLGAMVAAVVARRRPDLVEALLLEDGPFFFTEGAGWEAHWLQDARFRPLRHALQRRDREQMSEDAFAALYADMPFPAAPDSGGGSWADRLPADAVRRRAAKDFQVDSRVLETACTARFADFGHAETLSRIAAPTLFLAADPAVSPLLPPDTGDRVGEVYGGPRFELIACPGAGHEIHRDDPARYVAAVRQLARI